MKCFVDSKSGQVRQVDAAVRTAQGKVSRSVDPFGFSEEEGVVNTDWYEDEDCDAVLVT